MSKQTKKYQPKPTPPVQREIKKTAGWKPHLVFTILAFVLYSNTLNHSFALDDGVVMVENEFTQEGIKGIPGIFKYDTFVGWFLSFNKEKTADQVQEEMKYVAGGRYRPLSLVTFALEVQFFGGKNAFHTGKEFKANTFVSHLDNILLYLLTTCLLYLILCRLAPPAQAPPSPPEGGDVERTSRSIRTSLTSPPSGGLGGAWAGEAWYLSFPFIVTLLFLAHPIHTEAVANIKGRDEIMTLLGSLGALWFTIKYFDTNKMYHLLLSGLCLFLGLLSKENAITFLALIPVTIYYFVDRKFGKIFKAMIPLIAATAIFLLIRASILGMSVEAPTTHLSLLNNPFLDATKSETTATIFYTLLLYVKLLFFPHPLTHDYYPFHIEIVNWLNPVAILSLLFYLGITAYAIYGLFKPPLTPPKGENYFPPLGGLRGAVSYSIWFYLLPLTIVSNLFFPIGVFMGERFIFISSIGFCIFIGWLIYNYLPQMTKTIKSSNYLTCFVMIIILCLFSIKTVSRNMAWKDDFTLIETDVKTSKNSARGNYVFGLNLLQKAVVSSNENEAQQKDELCEKSAQYLKHALEVYPGYPDAIEQLGNLYFDCYKDVAQSLHYYAMALQTNTTRSPAVCNSVVSVLSYIGNWNNYASLSPSEIIRLCSELLEARPDFTISNEVIRLCDELLKEKPDFGEVYYFKGLIYGKYLNDMESALIYFEKALAIDFPKAANFYSDLGACYAISGNYEKALPHLLKAIELGADDNVVYTNLGIVYWNLDDKDTANFYIQKGKEMKENN